MNDKLATIRKVLALAEGGATEGEREAALAKAQRLMTAYGIDQAMIDAAAPAGKRELVEHTDMLRDEKRSMMVKAKRELIFGMAPLFNCSALRINDRAYMRVFGHTTDLELFQLMYNSIMVQLITGVEAAKRDRDVSGTTGVVNYAHAYVRRVVGRLRAARDTTTVEANNARPGTDLVLADRTAIVDARIATIYPKIRTIGSGNAARFDPTAYARGGLDGSRADLGQSRVTNGNAPRQLG